MDIEQKNGKMNIKITELCKDAVDLWGYQSQEDMCVEECNELIHSILKHRRGKATVKDILEEIVDVQIMLVQMRIILNDEPKFWEIFNQKLDRLKNKTDVEYTKRKG